MYQYMVYIYYSVHVIIKMNYSLLRVSDQKLKSQTTLEQNL